MAISNLERSQVDLVKQPRCLRVPIDPLDASEPLEELFRRMYRGQLVPRRPGLDDELQRRGVVDQVAKLSTDLTRSYKYISVACTSGG